MSSSKPAPNAAWTDAEQRVLSGILKESPIKSLEDHKRFKPDPSTNIAGNRFLEKGHLTLLTAEISCGKSTLTTQLAVQLASGSPLLGSIQVHGPQKVLLVAAESSDDTMQRDFMSITEQLKISKIPRENLGTWIPADPGKLFDELPYLLKTFRPSVLVLDPYLSFVVGMDASGQGDSSLWRSAMSALLRDYQCALLLATHTKKPQNLRSKVPVIQDCIGVRLAYMAFGSTTIPNWARAGMELTEIAETQNGERQFVLNFSKARERTGIKDETGRYVQYLVVRHSKDPDRPLWSLSDSSDSQLKSSWKMLFDMAARKNNGIMPSLDVLTALAQDSKTLESDSRKRSTVGRKLKLYYHERDVVKLSGDSKRRYVIGRKKMEVQSSESARTGTGVVTGVKTEPPSTSTKRSSK